MNKIYSFLGLAAKAGRVVSGDESSERAIKAGKVQLVIVSCDASSNTRKKFSNMCTYRSIDLRIFGDKDNLGKFVGKDKRTVVCVLDKGFSAQLVKLIDGFEFESGGDNIVESKNI